MSALDLTGGDLVRALRRITTRPTIDRAVRARAEALAGAIRDEDAGVTAEVLGRGPSEYVVIAAGPNLFAREFGAVDGPADKAIGRAFDEITLPHTPLSSRTHRSTK